MDSGSNLVDLYMYSAMAGETEIPVDYHFWCCCSVIAAALQDRVVLKNFLGLTKYPNLYTFLIGDSGSGKGAAIEHACRIIAEIEVINPFLFRGTAPALIDTMSAIDKEQKYDKDGAPIDKSKTFIITPELKDNIGSGPKAADFIGFVTNMWNSIRSIPMVESTRGHGAHVIINPVVNWLAGSTKEWLMETVTRSDIQGGFFGRVACVQTKDVDLRIPKINLPPDIDKITNLVIERVYRLAHISGEMKFTADAEHYFLNWYGTRERPDGPTRPIWRRSSEIALKLAMILAAADQTMAIGVPHIKRAREISEKLLFEVNHLISYANVTPKTETIYRITVILKQLKKVPKSILLKESAATLDDFDLALRTLTEAGSVRIAPVKGKPVVEWVGA